MRANGAAVTESYDKILKSGARTDDNDDVTIVISLQILVATLAGLLLLETRLRRDERARTDEIEAASAADVDFHPELIVAWDDEANYARRSNCTRSASRDHCDVRRSSLVPAHPHQRQR